jgi:hypothetical protein
LLPPSVQEPFRQREELVKMLLSQTGAAQIAPSFASKVHWKSALQLGSVQGFSLAQ